MFPRLLVGIALPLLALAADRPAVRIALVGDSTVNDEGGWGPGFRASFDARVEVRNFAMNGRSSKSFLDEKRWEPVLAFKPDYVLIQFGHNDAPGKGPERETDPASTFRENLMRYVTEARGVGAKPVLVTSIVRRNFYAEGKIKHDSLIPYAQAAREVAAAAQVPLMDMHALTLKQSEELGPRAAESLGARDKAGKLDTTHLSATGRKAIGEIAAKEFVRVVPAMREYFQ